MISSLVYRFGWKMQGCQKRRRRKKERGLLRQLCDCDCKKMLQGTEMMII